MVYWCGGLYERGHTAVKILVLFTGGTIGSRANKDWVSVDSAANYILLKHFEQYQKEVEFVTASPYSILSENLSAGALNLLQAELTRQLAKDYDGIIVTHGTDTLQYSAVAAEYAFGDCKIPIVFVSAAYPLEDARTNGFSNFEAAVEFIKSKASGGVFVSYKNDGEGFTGIHIPTRLLQHRECDADLHSIDGQPYAIYTDKIEVNAVPTAKKINALGAVQYAERAEILVVDSHPGDGYAYDLARVKAVLVKPYHSATLNTENACFAEFCKSAAEKGIPVYAANVRGGVSYESTKLFEALHIGTLPYCTFVSMYMKAWAALSMGEDVQAFMQKRIANEFKE